MIIMIFFFFRFLHVDWIIVGDFVSVYLACTFKLNDFLNGPMMIRNFFFFFSFFGLGLLEYSH